MEAARISTAGKLAAELARRSAADGSRGNMGQEEASAVIKRPVALCVLTTQIRVVNFAGAKN